MNQEQWGAHVARIEAEKDGLNANADFRPSLTFDEAIFAAAKPALKDVLTEVTAYEDIHDSTDLFEKYQAFCIQQIRAIVDVAICYLLARGAVAHHKQKMGRRRPILSDRHEILVPRARHLIKKLENPVDRSDLRNRCKTLMLTTADEMNTMDWKTLARGFYANYRRASAS